MTIGIWLLLIAGTAAAYFYLEADIENLNSETSQKEMQFTQTEAELETTEKNVVSNISAKNFFDKFKSSKDNDPGLFRKNYFKTTLSDIMSSLNLKEIRLEYKPENDFKDYATLKSTNTTKVSAAQGIKLYFSAALTDLMIFQVMDSLQKKLPGTVYFKSMILQKEGEITSDTLLQISNGTIPSLASAEVELDWISCRYEAEEEANPTTPTATKGGV